MNPVQQTAKRPTTLEAVGFRTWIFGIVGVLALFAQMPLSLGQCGCGQGTSTNSSGYYGSDVVLSGADYIWQSGSTYWDPSTSESYSADNYAGPAGGITITVALDAATVATVSGALIGYYMSGQFYPTVPTATSGPQIGGTTMEGFGGGYFGWSSGTIEYAFDANQDFIGCTAIDSYIGYTSGSMTQPNGGSFTITYQSSDPNSSNFSQGTGTGYDPTAGAFTVSYGVPGGFIFTSGSTSGGSSSSGGQTGNSGSGGTAPTAPSFGPDGIWVGGTTFAWTGSSFVGNAHATGSDSYGDGSSSGFWVMVTCSGAGSVFTVSGVTASGYWSGNYDPSSGIFNVPDNDVRAADSGGNVIYAIAPSGVPAAIRVDSPWPLWNYLGFAGGLHHYGGVAGLTATLDVNGNLALSAVNAPFDSGFYYQGVIWNTQHDVRAVLSNGQAPAATSTPLCGWSRLWVQAIPWDYVISVTDAVANIAPGDYFMGLNANQRLFISTSGLVTITGAPGQGSGTCLNGTFQVPGLNISGVDPNGNANGSAADQTNLPAYGPPAIWVSGDVFAFSTSAGGVDEYGDGSGQTILVSPGGVSALDGSRTLEWTGSYAPAHDPSQSGVFLTGSQAWWFDVRAYGVSSPLTPEASPMAGHPLAVRVGGPGPSWLTWLYAGTSASAVDYYLGYGAAAGQRLLIDPSDNVTMWMYNASDTPQASGVLEGTVFLINGQDVRAGGAGGGAAIPATSPSWGPANVCVNSVVWNYLGTVSDDGLNIHADYYGGPNAGEILTVDSSLHVAASGAAAGGGPANGSYEGGVFVVSNADIRGLDANGSLQTPQSPELYGAPSDLRIGGLHWAFLGSANGMNYYGGDQSGQRLSIDANGAVAYADTPDGLTSASGTYSYAAGTFSAGSGGGNFNAGTVTGDVDILGNILSLGSLADDKNTVGLTIGFGDNSTQKAATVQFCASRPSAAWLWSSGGSPTPANGAPQMQLDSGNRLTIYQPGENGYSPIVLDPAAGGISRLPGRIHIEAQGDLDMGPYTIQPSS